MVNRTANYILPWSTWKAAACKTNWETDGNLVGAKFCKIGIQVCDALKLAHVHGIIHRDLKPANLMYTEDETVKLADFGIAKLFGESQITAAGGVIGTADYMSPEQAKSEKVTVRSDLYSLGTVMYALLARKPPFAADSVMAVINGVCNDPPKPLRRVAHEVPDPYARLIAQLLEKDPQNRIPTALALGNQLRAMEHALSVETRVDTSAAEKRVSRIEIKPEQKSEKTKASDGDRRTEEFTAAGTPSEIGEAATRLEETMDSAMPSDEDVEYKLAEGITVTPPFTSYTQVTDEDRGAVSIFDRGESEGTDWSTIKSVGGLSLLIVVCVLAAWIWTRPLSADRLYEDIVTAYEHENPNELLLVEGEIKEFIARFPDDDRITKVKEAKHQRTWNLEETGLEIDARKAGGIEHLLPYQQAFLHALRMHRNNKFKESRELLQSFLDEFKDSEGLDDTGKKYIRLAEDELKREMKIDEDEETVTVSRNEAERPVAE